MASRAVLTKLNEWMILTVSFIHPTSNSCYLNVNSVAHCVCTVSVDPQGSSRSCLKWLTSLQLSRVVKWPVVLLRQSAFQNCIRMSHLSVAKDAHINHMVCAVFSLNTQHLLFDLKSVNCRKNDPMSSSWYLHRLVMNALVTLCQSVSLFKLCLSTHFRTSIKSTVTVCRHVIHLSHKIQSVLNVEQLAELYIFTVSSYFCTMLLGWYWPQ